MALTLHGTVADNTAVLDRRSAKPIIINGDMQVAQRSVEVTGLGDGDEGYVTVDRFRHSVGAGAGRFTSKQTDVTDLAGFSHALELDCTTADTSIAAGEYIMLEQRLEGQDVQGICKGTADAKPVTVSFYVKANGSFTFGLELSDNDNTRQITKLLPQLQVGLDTKLLFLLIHQEHLMMIMLVVYLLHFGYTQVQHIQVVH